MNIERKKINGWLYTKHLVSLDECIEYKIKLNEVCCDSLDELNIPLDGLMELKITPNYPE